MRRRLRIWLNASPLRRFKVLVGIALVVLALGNAVALEQQRMAYHRDCMERQDRARATAPVLDQLATAARLDHDSSMASAWQKYLDAAKANPLPSC